jgi:hypothetical protein
MPDKDLHMKLDGELFKGVEDFRFENRMRTVKDAIETLLRKALGMKPAARKERK